MKPLYILCTLACVITVILLCTTLGTSWYQCIRKEQPTDTHGKVVLLFDIHEVLVHKPKKSIFTKLFAVRNKLRCAKELAQCLFNKKVRTHLVKQARNKNKVTESYFKVLKEENFPTLYEGCMNYATDIYAEPVPGMTALLQELKQQGCRLYLFSNIGPELLERLAQRFPETFSYFADAQGVVKNTINNDLHQSSTDSWIGKPHPDAYATALKNTGIEKPSQVFFIDDKVENVKAACKAGMNGITFTDVARLRTILKENGLQLS